MAKQPTLLNFFQKVTSPRSENQNQKCVEKADNFKTPKKPVQNGKG